MHPLLLPFVSYAFLTIFTPGPNNVSASALGSKFGYRRTIPYILGMAGGMFIILLTSGLLTDFLRENYSRAAAYLRWLGAGYMIWLAISLFRSAPKNKAGQLPDPGPLSGFLLAVLNPKGILFAITIFASFAALIATSTLVTVGSSVLLTIVMVVACSTWAVTGAALASLFKNRWFALSFNIVMALFLAYSAYSILVH